MTEFPSISDGLNDWKAQNQSWRKKPSISPNREEELKRIRKVNISLKKYPFDNCRLDRADIEWLIATHESDGILGPIDCSDEKHINREGLDLRGATLTETCEELPLQRMRGGITLDDCVAIHDESKKKEFIEKYVVRFESLNLQDIHLEEAILSNVELIGVQLWGACLQKADLTGASLQGILGGWKRLKQFFEVAEESDDQTKERPAHFEQACLERAHLEDAKLIGAYLDRAILLHAEMQRVDLSGASLTHADLRSANLTEAKLQHAICDKAIMAGTTLVKADLTGASLKKSILINANLTDTEMRNAHLEGADLSGAQLITKDKPHFMPAKLQGVYFDNATDLKNMFFGNKSIGYPTIADIRWQGVNLAVIPWRVNRLNSQKGVMGEERLARQKKKYQDNSTKSRKERLREFEDAVRANRQLATTLRDQGLSSEADYFAYHAQICQRAVLWRSSRFHIAAWSFLLDKLNGYGYRPMTSVMWYIAIIVTFSLAYIKTEKTFRPQPFNAFIFSIASFHGRGFFSTGQSLQVLTVALAAVEAIIGLLIEVSFIATFTQRYIGK